MAGPLRESVAVEQIGFLLPRAKASFLGCCVKDLGHRIVSAVTVSGASADCGMFTKTMEDLAAQEEATVCPGPGRGCRGDVPRTFGAGQHPSQREVSWVQALARLLLQGPDAVRGSGLLHQGVRRLCVAQVGQVAVGVCCVVWMLGCVLANRRVVRVVAGGQKGVVEGSCAAVAGEEGCWGVENGVMLNPPFLMEARARSQTSCMMATWMIPQDSSRGRSALCEDCPGASCGHRD